jgi:hypothetical protein
VESRTKISTLDFALWAAQPSQPVEELRREVIVSAQSDAELARAAFCAEYSGNVVPLRALMHELDQSARLLDRARAITLECLLADSAVSTEQSAEDSAWLTTVRSQAARWARANAHARHWYGRFIGAPSDLDAWAAFRLLLRCVDKRIWLWKAAVDAEQTAPPSEDRRVFFATNEPLVLRMIEKHEMPLAKTLVGTDILNASAWPWMDTPEKVTASPQ